MTMCDMAVGHASRAGSDADGVSTPSSPWWARERVLLVLLVAGMLASLPFLVHDFWDPRPDAARYLLAARSLADGDGYAVMGEPFRLRPPGFSALLAPLVAWRGFDFLALNAFVSLFGVLAVAMLYLLLVPRTGAIVAFAVAALVWLNPQLQELSNQVMSDVPALALALLFLVLLRRANTRPSLRRDLPLVLVLAAAIYVRSSNLLLVPAFVLDRACALWLGRAAGAPRVAPPRGGAAFVRNRILLPLAIVLVLYLPWLLAPSFTSRYDSPDLHSYGTAFLNTDPNDPDAPALGVAGWRARVADNATAYAAMFASSMTTRRPSALAPVAAGLGVVALLVALVRRREAPEWFALGSAAVLVVYYVAALRLLLPVWVLAVAALADTTLWLVARVVARRSAELVVAALVLAAIVLAPSGGDPTLARAESDSMRAAAAHLAQTVAPGEAIGGDVGAVYALLLDRPVYSLRPLTRRGQDEELQRLLDAHRIVAVVASRPGPFDPVVARLRSDGARIVELPHHVVVHRAARAVR